MSRSAGTLITTNNATYIPPRFMPGYQGHVPTMKFDYAETYGNATAKHFQDYRSQTLNNSKSNYAQGGYFPSYYTHQPELVIGNRTRNRDRWLSAPRYQLTNLDYDRKEELIKFDKMSQGHRDHYNDKSGTAHRVNYFVLPSKPEDQFKRYKPFMMLSASYSSEMDLSADKILSSRSSVRRSLKPVSSQRDREMRDVYFESR